MSSTYVMKDGFGEAELCGKTIAQRLQPDMARCVREVLGRIAANTTTFCFCDFGSADGKSSSTVAKTVALQLLKSSGAPREISVVLEDQERNDFRPAFAHVTKSLEELNMASFVSSVARSFFAQCLPAGSLHFGTSNFALHFLDLTTPPRAGFKLGYTFELLHRLRQVDGNLSALSDDDQAQVEANKAKGAIDWQQFLLCRAKELCVGGRLLIATLGSFSPSSEEYSQNSSRVFRNEQEELEFVVNAVHSMIADGEIGEDEADDFIFCAHYRTLEEVKAPFLSADLPVRQAGLRLVRAEMFLNKYPDEIDSVESLSGDDVKRFAAADCRIIQAYLWPLLKRGFSAKAGRSEKEANLLTEMAFERVEKEMIEKRWFNIGNVMFLAEVEKEY